MIKSPDSQVQLSTVWRMNSLDSMEGIALAEASQPSCLLGLLPFGTVLYTVYPGLLIALTIGLASTWLSQHYNAPVMLFALLFGVAFNFLYEERRCIAGIEFASRPVLRAGVALLGARITLEKMASLGIGPLIMVVTGVATTVAFGVAMARRLGLTRKFGILSGGAVAICGASAALALSSVLPADQERERNTILTVVTVTALSTLAMIVYPVIATALHMGPAHAGIFLGGTIHDVAQVVGAGYTLSQETGDVATYVKLIRVAMLLPLVASILLLMTIFNPGNADGRVPQIPFFLIGFALLVLTNSFVALPQSIVDGTTDISRWCLVTAIAALGVKTSFRELMSVGWRPVVLLVAETIWIALLVLFSVESLI